MRHPLGIWLVTAQTFVLGFAAAVLLGDRWEVAAPASLVGLSAIALFHGAQFARRFVALINLSAIAWLGVSTYRSAAYLQTELQMDLGSLAQHLWPAALVFLLGCAAACYLYSANANAFLISRRTLGLRRSSIASIVIGGAFVLGAWAFVYTINPRLMKWPVRLDEAVEIVISGLSPEDRAQLAQATDDELVGYHFGLGMAIRNDFALWGGNTRLLRSACGGEYCHPDIASTAILMAVRDELRNRPPNNSLERSRAP